MTLQVKLFGHFEVWQEGRLIEEWPRQKTQELFKLLIAEQGRVFSQDQLIEALFPDLDPHKARNNLQKRISELRRVLEPAMSRGTHSQFVLQAKGHDPGYFFSKEARCEIDLTQFEQEIEAAARLEQIERWAQAIEHYQKAIEIYRGEFLADSLYEEWTIALRERWREKYLNALTQLAEAHARLGQLTQAIESCDKILKSDPWNERIFRQKMLYLYHSANRAKALETYQHCVEVLKTHLETNPSPETIELKEQILKYQVTSLPRAIPNNLPQALTSFIGRTRELAEIETLLGQTKLVTLTGVGGCGKTRLGLQIAFDLLKEYTDGAWWVELAALSDPSLVTQAIASALGVQEQPKKTVLAVVSDFLHAKQALLVLDNCEHLIEASATIAQELLKTCPKLQILATSREPFGVLGETVYQVPPLSIPTESEEKLEIEKLRTYEALRLFEERARANDAKFALSSDNATAVVQICKQLDGIPLAIELAAARVRALSVQQIAARLDDRFRLLTGGNRAALPRHQTLEATMDWSYHLLTPKEQALLRRLSVFAGGWTLEAAEPVCTDETLPTPDIWELLAHLVDKSLVLVEKSKEETRYKMLETVKQYSLAKLKGAGEMERVQERHLDFFLKLAEQAEPELVGPKQKEWLDRLEGEHDNLRAAIEWVLEIGKYAIGIQLASSIGRFWQIRGHWLEGTKIFEQILKGEVSIPKEQRARVLRSLGLIKVTCGDYKQAKELVICSLKLSYEIDDQSAIADLSNVLGTIATRQGEYETALRFYKQSIKINEKLENAQGIAISRVNLGYIAEQQGDYKSAERFFEQSMAIWVQLGNTRGIAQLLNHLGSVKDDQGEYAHARDYFERSLALQQEIKDKGGIAIALNNLGVVNENQNKYVEAKKFYEQGLKITLELGDKRSIALSLHNLGVVSRKQGNYKEAQSSFRQSLIMRREIGDNPNIIISLEEQAKLNCIQGKKKLATLLLGTANNLRRSINSPIPSADRPDYDRTVSSLRSSLGDEAFEKYWAEGRAMSMEQAIEYALSTELEEAAENAIPSPPTQ